MGDVTNEVNTGVVQQAVPTLETPQDTAAVNQAVPAPETPKVDVMKDTATVNQAVPAPETPKEKAPGWLTETDRKLAADNAVTKAIENAKQPKPEALKQLEDRMKTTLNPVTGFVTVGTEAITPETPPEHQRAAVQKAIEKLEPNPTGTAPPTEPTAK